MDFGIIVLIIVGLLYIGGLLLLRKYREYKYTDLVVLILSVLAVMLVIFSRFYYEDHSKSNTFSLVFLSIITVLLIGKMLYKRNKSK